jgi:hypothetical protein
MLKKMDVFGKEMYKCGQCGAAFAVPHLHRGVTAKSEPLPLHNCPLDRSPKMSELIETLSKRS